MNRQRIRLVLPLPWGEDGGLRLAAARYLEARAVVRPTYVRRFAVEVLAEWAEQETRAGERRRDRMRRLEELRAAAADDLARSLERHPLPALLDVAAELREVERELRALALGPAAHLAGELLALATELEATIPAE